MRKIFTFILALIVGAGTLFAAGGTFGKDGNNLTWDYTSGVLTISGTGEMENFSSSNHAPWYSYRASITSVVVNNGVTNFINHTLEECSALVSISFPASTTFIQSTDAFDDCSSLMSIDVDAANPKYYSKDGVLFDKEKPLLRRYPRGRSGAYIIPDGIQDIGWSAFDHCSGLTSLIIPSSVTNLRCFSLNFCTGLESITCFAVTPPETEQWAVFQKVSTSIPVYVPAAGYSDYKAHEQWKKFKIQTLTCGDNLTWTLSDSVLTISGTGDMAYWNKGTAVPWYSCRTAIKSVVIEDGVTNIGDIVFSGCSNIKSVSIPASVKSLGDYAFSGCAAMKNIILPDGLTTIGDNAFYMCSGLATVTIPAGVTAIGEGAFQKCTGLTSIISKAATPPACDNNCFDGVTKSIPVYVPVGTVSDYKATTAQEWKDFTNIQEIKSVLASGTCGKNGDNLTWELSSDGVLTISGTGEMADYNIDDPSWQPYLSSINTVKIEEGVTSIGKATFYMATSITSVTMPSSLTTIEGNAFRFCDGLTYVEIPKGVTSIGLGPFDGCETLTYIEVSSNNDNYCSVDGVLFNKDKTTLLQYPGGLKGAYSIPNTVQTIASCAFDWSIGLTAVTIPASVTKIDDWNFYGCPGLLSVVCLANTPPTLGQQCFKNVNMSISLYVPKGKVEAYRDVTRWAVFNNIQEIGYEHTAYELVDLSTDQLTEGQYIIVFDDNRAHAEVSNIDLIASTDELFILDGVAYVPNNAVCAVTITPYGTDSIAILLADGENYLDLQKKNTVATSATLAKLAIADGGNQTVNISKYLASENKIYTLKCNHGGAKDFFRMYTATGAQYSLPKLYRKKGTQSGVCGMDGDNLTWTLNEEGVLTISGTGEMRSFVMSDPTWKPFALDVKSIVIEEGVTSIGTFAFCYCTAATSVSFPGSVTSIGNYPFTDCDIKSPVYNDHVFAFMPLSYSGAYAVPEGIEIIAGGAFYGCSGLTSLKIPASVTDIGIWALYHCFGLESITCLATTPPACYSTFESVDKDIPLYVPKGKVPVYKAENAKEWNEFNNILEIDGETAIDQIYEDGILNGQSSDGKFFRDGQLFFLRDGKVYTVTGQEVR